MPGYSDRHIDSEIAHTAPVDAALPAGLNSTEQNAAARQAALLARLTRSAHELLLKSQGKGVHQPMGECGQERDSLLAVWLPAGHTAGAVFWTRGYVLEAVTLLTC